MCGIKVDRHLSIALAGLYVAGEVIGGVHGANCLGGNALTEAFVFGAEVGTLAGRFAGQEGNEYLFQENHARRAVGEISGGWAGNIEGSLPSAHAVQSVLGDCAGILRSRKKMDAGLRQVESLQERVSRVKINPAENLFQRIHLRQMLTVSEMIQRSALIWSESRGAHFRKDFPEQGGPAWKANVCVQRDKDGRMRMALEPLMEG